MKDDQFKKLTAEERIKELKRLKKALELERVRSEGYRHMIGLAEKQFKIPIRNK